MRTFAYLFICILLAAAPVAEAGPAGKAVRETAEWIAKKFGSGSAGKTADEIAVATARVVERHGDEAIPLLRAAGHAGFDALEAAGKQAPDVIKLFARHGDEAVWLISQPRKLAVFCKYGDGAADALLKHPGIADDLIERLGANVIQPLQQLGKSGAQQLGMAAKEGLFEATPRSAELLGVIGRFGDRAMEFVWKNKGALAVTAVLATFLNDPEPYIQGAKDLIVEPVAALGSIVAHQADWTKVLSIALIVGAALMALKVWLQSRRTAR